MLEIGSLIDGKYKILNKIGQGGMSVVYLAMNEKANKQWAVKEVRKDGVKDFEVVKQGLIVETDMLKRLNHPNLPSIVDVIEDRDTLLIVMDYIQGNPLSRAIEEYGAQPQKSVIEWAKQLCNVLDYLHTRTPGIVYRDMKPANVMLKPDGNIMLIDFGTAREFKEKKLADTTCLGTVGYAAPEQFGGQGQTDARTDIYCLGATLFHLVTGHNPSEPPYEMRPIREINPSLSSGLEKIIQKCIQRNPADRYQSCAELMYALEHYEEIDDIHFKKQRKKLRIFIASLIVTISFGIISGFGYFAAKEKQEENYDVKILSARAATKSQEEQIQDYLAAIEIDQTQPTAYLEIITLFLSSNEEDGALTKEEASVITQLQAGMDVIDSNGFSKTIYPFDHLKKGNANGYAEVCYEIAMAYWYDYTVESDRYSYAVEWFQEVVNVSDKYPLAQIYCDIGECQQQIKKYAGQNRTEKMYDEYKNLWNKLLALKEASFTIADNDAKILVWSELVDTTSSQVIYFIVNVKAADMITLLDDIAKQATEMKSTTKYEDIKTLIDGILFNIKDAKLRVDSTSN